MPVRTSTGICAQMLPLLVAALQDGVIQIRSGPPPASADAAASGTLLGLITRNGGVFTPGSPVNGLRTSTYGRIVAKDPAQSWVLAGIAGGTAGHFRWLGNAADNGLLSTTAPRIDGNVGLEGAGGDIQLYLPTLSITPETAIDITQFWYAMPPIGD